MNIVERLRIDAVSVAAFHMNQVQVDCNAAADEIERLRKIESAAKNLLAVKGRHHTEQAYKALEELLKGEK